MPSESEQQNTWIWFLESPGTIIFQNALLLSFKFLLYLK